MKNFSQSYGLNYEPNKMKNHSFAINSIANLLEKRLEAFSISSKPSKRFGSIDRFGLGAYGL
jgi:hypothetical protein